MSSRSNPSRKTSRPSATSNPTTTVPRSAGARGPSRPTGTSSRVPTSSAPKYTEITRGRFKVNGIRDDSQMRYKPTFFFTLLQVLLVSTRARKSQEAPICLRGLLFLRVDQRLPLEQSMRDLRAGIIRDRVTGVYYLHIYKLKYTRQVESALTVE